MTAISPEYRTIQRNTAKITLNISTTTDLNFFADRLVENDFISKLTANGIVQTMGFTNYNKASQLMQAVESHISTASNPTTAFEAFIEILKGISALEQLADELVQYYSKCFGHHFMIYIVHTFLLSATVARSLVDFLILCSCHDIIAILSLGTFPFIYQESSNLTTEGLSLPRVVVDLLLVAAYEEI